MNKTNRILIGLVITLLISLSTTTFLWLRAENKSKEDSNKDLTSNQAEQVKIDSTINEKENNDAYEKQYIDGMEVSGKIEIPKVNLDMPVFAKAVASALDISVGIQAGNELNKIGNSVIAGYANHYYGDFTQINELTNGDIIYVTDYKTNNKVEYQVYEVIAITSRDGSYVQRETNGYREITLYTMNYSNTEKDEYGRPYDRLIVKAREITN